MYWFEVAERLFSLVFFLQEGCTETKGTGAQKWQFVFSLLEVDDGELMLNVLRCHLTYWGQVVTNAEARFNKRTPWSRKQKLFLSLIDVENKSCF